MTTRARRTSKPITRRHPADVRRGLVLDAAAALIADEGLLAATMRRIADVSGVSLGTLTHHFKSLDELLGATLERASSSFTQALAQSQADDDRPADVRLAAMFEAVLPVRAAPARQWRLWLQFWSRALYDGALSRVNARRYRAWRTAIAGLIQAGVAETRFRHGLDVQTETHKLVALMDGLCVAVALRDPAVRPARARTLVRSALAALAG